MNIKSWDSTLTFKQPTFEQQRAITYIRHFIDSRLKRLTNDSPLFQVDAAYAMQDVKGNQPLTLVGIKNPALAYCLYILGLTPVDDQAVHVAEVDIAEIDTWVPTEVYRYSGSDISKLLEGLGYSGELIVFNRYGFMPLDQPIDTEA